MVECKFWSPSLFFHLISNSTVFTAHPSSAITRLSLSAREVSPPLLLRSRDPTSPCMVVTSKRRTSLSRTSRVLVSTPSRSSTGPRSLWMNGLWSRSSSPCSTFLEFGLRASFRCAMSSYQESSAPDPFQPCDTYPRANLTIKCQ